MSPSWAGLIAASLGVLSSSGHNVMCANLMVKYNFSSARLVRETAPLQAMVLFILCPLVDKMLVGAYPWEWKTWQTPFEDKCMSLIIVTCMLAVAVNMSLVSCIRKYTATGALS